ncbi:MAG: SDR family oxidoreductase [Dehalococcoidia bacterium]
MELGLSDKVVIVTGGGSNVGRGIVMGFAEEGANVVNAEIDVSQGQSVVDDACSLGTGQTILVPTDVTNWNSVQAMVQKTLEKFGRIDVLVNNAGGTPSYRPFIKKSRDEWEKEINLNYWGVINCIRAVLDHMIERKAGRIVNIASGSGQIGSGAMNLAVYGGTKGGVIALSRGLAWELGRHGITVNCVSPGWIVPDSEAHTGEKSFWNQWGYDFFTPEKLEIFKKSWPVPRFGNPRDIADCVLFVASDRASYLTGQTINVGGGVAMW